VSERDLTGKVIWRHGMTNPFHCQRLANGNTFMASRNQLLEVDRAGKPVTTHNRPTQDIMAARKLRDGQIVFITTTGAYNRMGPDGKIVKSFPVGPVQTFVRIDVLPNGRVLVPQYGTSRVVEYDGDGKQVWQAPVPNPTSAMRLPNGNTLVGSLSGSSVLELDRSGKQIWSHQAAGQVWRASRR
jgi:streptogramin lyase